MGVETDTEAIMPDFAFDESMGIDENLDAFFSHLESYDEEFAAHLKAELPTFVDDDVNRAVFNEGVVEMLDNESELEAKDS